MTIKAVEAVFVARYTQSNFRAVYGRLSTETASTYTKDFLQVLQEAGDKLASVLQGSRTEDTDIEYVWPTGTCPGKFIWREPRWQMKWFTGQKPLPWTVGDTPSPEVSIPGNPNLKLPELADAEYQAILRTGTEPWFVAIKLVGEPKVLHVRTYFRNPSAEFADRALSLLPTVVLELIDALPPGDGSGTVILPTNAQIGPPRKPRAAKLVDEIRAALEREPNVLLVGPPGTGKTVALEDLQALYDDSVRPGTVFFDTSVWGDAWSVEGREARSDVLVFHPSYSYENFVAGLYPTSNGQSIALEARPGPLLCLGHWVGNSERQALLVIDEFNRGSAAAIFGDCLSLLDKDKRTSVSHQGARITRPYIEQPMAVPPSYRENSSVPEYIADEVRLPAGLHIVAAMNSTDRSVAPLDAAMRRRFTVIRVGPDYEALAEHLGLLPEHFYSSLPNTAALTAWQVDDVSRLAVQLLKTLNERIEFCLGEDFLLGHALLWNITADTTEERVAQLSNLVDAKLVSTLRMTFVDQDDALGAILSVDDGKGVSAGQDAPAGTIAYWKIAPPSLASINEKRLVIQRIGSMDLEGQLAALKALL